MKVHEDYSHCDMEAVKEGLLSVRVYSFRLEMYISEEQKKVNRETAGRLTREQWAERCFQRRKEAGKSVTGIMKHIAAQFRVGQWDKPWNAPGPNDLWFWCRDDGRGGRDLSYVTLKVEYATHKEDTQKLNPKDTVERMIRFLNGNPAADIEATIQYETIDNAPMIRIRAMENFMRLYKGKVSYNLMQGRGVYVNNQYYFMKSRAKSKGYALSELEVCRLVAA